MADEIAPRAEEAASFHRRGARTFRSRKPASTPTQPEDDDRTAEARARCRELMSLNPGARFAVSRSGEAVGVWCKDQRFVEVLMRTITNQWVWLVEDGQIRTSLVNGQPLYKPEDWEEVHL